MKRVIPELLVEDMSKSLDFYVGVLGLEKEVIFPEDKPVFAKLTRGEVKLMVYVRDEFEKEIAKFGRMKMGGTVGLFIEVEDVNDWYKRIGDKATVIQDLHETDYGTKEFSFEDVNGYVWIMVENN
jgi:uncharacterized glyoxalase superfamily protein PhnB